MDTQDRKEQEAIEKEALQKEKKLMRRMEIEESTSYKMIKWISTLMDKYLLDPVIGMFPVVGDILSTLTTLPFIYVSLFKVRSIPLTLAIIANALIDVLIGIIPYWLGNLLDIFNRSNLRNFKLITGFVEGDEEIIHKVNKSAIWMVVIIVVVCIAIGLLISLVMELGAWAGGLLYSRE